MPGLEQPVDETQAELGLRRGECVLGGNDVKRVVLTDLSVEPWWRERVCCDDGELVDAVDEQPIECLRCAPRH